MTEAAPITNPPPDSAAEPRWQRLHPTSLVFNAVSRLWALIVPLVLFFVFKPGGTWELWLGGIVAIGMFFEAWMYFTTKYRLAERELIVHRGLLFRSERHVPYSRIQNVDLIQNPLHRLFRVAVTRIETAGGNEPEAMLKVLSLDAVEAMRARIFQRRSSDAFASDQPHGVTAHAESEDATGSDALHDTSAREILVLSTGELVRLGLTSVRGFALVAAFVALLWQFDIFEQIVDRFDEISERVTEAWRLLNGTAAIGIWVYIVLVVVALTIFLLLSIVWAILKFHGFRLVRSGDDLRFTCGLLSRFSATVPRNRIQLISVRESFVHRWMRRITIRVETAGGAGDNDDESAHFSQKWIMPIVRRDAVDSLLRELHDHATVSHIDWQPLARGAARRIVKKRLILTVVLCAPLAFLLHWWTFALAALLVPLVIWHGVLSARRMGYAHTSWGMIFRSGVLIRSISMTMFNKMQVVTARTTPFDRRHRMARLFVDTAGAGPAEHSIAVPYLPAETVESLRLELSAKAQQSRWRI